MCPSELVNNELTLDFWVDAQGHIQEDQPLLLPESCVASLTPNGPQFLVESEYEGYMGNYGETLDYWYRRAALVIQTPLGAELTRFELDFGAALADLVTLAHNPAQTGALTLRVTLLLPLLQQHLAHDDDHAWLPPYTELACALPDAELAQRLLSTLRPSQLSAPDAPLLRRLEQRHGTPWMLALLKAWADRYPRARPAELPAFTQAGVSAGLSPTLLDAWFDAHRTALTQREHELTQLSPVQRHLQALVTHVLALASRIQPRTALVPVVLAVGELAAHWPVALPLRQQVRQALEDELAEPERQADDHRLRGIDWACTCADCRQVIAWAQSPSGEVLRWPAVEAQRRHVEEALKRTGAPLAMETLRQGRPYSLVVRKTGNRWQEDRQQRERMAAALQALADGATAGHRPATWESGRTPDAGGAGRLV